ncbi:MAG: NAD-dependent epimerase/dehydratase family protein [Candidatus Saganbacteria bacterium]|nr:NAD-dependent epimerase/dehydratase family protein [Candidatus Saganbacteria bacterium]
MKQVLVTGAGGFIGTQLVMEMIRQGIDPICSEKDDGARQRLADIGVKNFCRNIQDLGYLDAVIHLAGRVHQMKERSQYPEREYEKDNIGLAVDVAQKSILKGAKKIIFASTVKVYGERPGHYTEKDPSVPEEPYGASKSIAESKLTELVNSSENARLVIMRFPMVFGPGNKGNMLPLLRAASKKLFLPLGASVGKRSVLYVGNLVLALLRALEHDVAEKVSVYNIKDADVSSGELYCAITRAMGYGERLLYVPEGVFNAASAIFPAVKKFKKRLFDEFVFDDSKFIETYGWRPKFTFDESIRNTVEWFRNP